MRNHKLLKLFITLATLLAGVCVAYSQSCTTQFAGTTFQPKTGVTDKYYNVENVKFDDPSSESITIGSTIKFKNGAPGTLTSGQYSINGTNGMVIHCTEAAEYNLFSYSLTGLKTTSGQNKYKIEVVMSSKKQSNCSTTRESWNSYVKLQIKVNNNDDYQTINFGDSWTYEKVFEATSSSMVFNFNSNNSNGCGMLYVKSIKVIGCVDQKIVSENGSKVCAGEENTFICKGITADTYKWEYSNDNKQNWTEIGSGESTVTVVITDECYVRCTANGTTLVSDVCRPVVCCSVAGTREAQLSVDFTSSRLTKSTTRVNFKNLDDEDSQSIKAPSYEYSSSGNVEENHYIITQLPKYGGYWDESEVEDNTHVIKGRAVTVNDGFLLINCNKDAGTMFEYIIESESLCKNTMYDFSAYIANLDPTLGHEPVNAGFFVYGMTGSAVKEELLNTETGDLSYTGGWVEKGESFNSGDYDKFKLLIRNNHVSQKATVVGNDIGIDDIEFSTCTPDVKIYTDSKYKSQDTIVCDDGKTVRLKLEAHAVYDLSSFFKTPYYIFQTSSDQTTWTIVKEDEGAKTVPYIEIDVDKEGFYKTGLYYRVWVGGDAAAVLKAAKEGKSSKGCGKLTAVSDPVFIKYECQQCTETSVPTVDDYAQCPTTQTAKKISDLVTSKYDKLRIYDSETGGTDLGADATFNPSVVGKLTYYVTNQQADAGDVKFCESERVAVNIEVKASATVTPQDIKTCFDDSTPDSKLTFTTDNSAFEYTWKSITGPAIDATGASYTLARNSSEGSINVTATDKTGALCPASATATYNIKRQQEFELSAPPTVCADVTANVIAKFTAGAGNYKWYKNGTEVASGTINETDNPKVATYSDKPTADATYKIEISDDLCNASGDTLVTVANEITIPVIAKSPVVNNNICSGTKFDVVASYTLQQGETMEWKVNGVTQSGVSGIELKDQGPTVDTKYEVSLIGGTCPGSGDVTVTVDTPANPVISADQTIVCAGTKITISDSDPETAKSYKWMRKSSDGGTYSEFEGQTGKDIKDYEPDQTYTYMKIATNGACTKNSNEVTVQVNPAIKYTLEPKSKPICEGASETLSVSGVNPADAAIEWIDKTTGQTISTDASITVTPTETTTYTVTLTKVCVAKDEVTITVDKPIIPDLKASKSMVCAGESIDIIDYSTDNAVTYKWERKITDLGDYEKFDGQNGKNVKNYVPYLTYTYRSTAVNGACTRYSNPVTVEVDQNFQIVLSALANDTICPADDNGEHEVTLAMTNYPTGATLLWTNETTGETVSTPTWKVSPQDAVTRFTAVATNVCKSERYIDITVMPALNPGLTPDKALCEGESVTLTVSGTGVKSVSWSPSAGLSSSKGATVTASPVVTTKYKATLSNGYCTNDTSVVVTIAPLPKFDIVQEIEGASCKDRGVVVSGKNGTPPYYYSTDGVSYYPESVLRGLPTGYSRVYIMDSNSCQGDTVVQLVPLEIIPDKFFTPNADGNNELWQVENLSCYEGYIVEIFDRYGKRLFVYKKGSFSGGSVEEDFPGWDGIYNGHQMPSDDYWYLITVEEIRKQFNGHFVLKR